LFMERFSENIVCALKAIQPAYQQLSLFQAASALSERNMLPLGV
jgi:hypothetical protein